MLLGRADGTFVEAAVPLGMVDTRDSRGVAAADFDHDGDVDFIVNNYRARAAYWVNEHRPRRRFLALRAPVGTAMKVAGQVRRVGAGAGYLGQHSTEQLFAVDGPAEVDVTWPDGRRERLGPFAAGTRHTLAQAAAPGLQARAVPVPSAPPAPAPDRRRTIALALLGLALSIAAIIISLRRRRRSR